MRGCIGTLEARCLINGFKDYALTRYFCKTCFFVHCSEFYFFIDLFSYCISSILLLFNLFPFSFLVILCDCSLEKHVFVGRLQRTRMAISENKTKAGFISSLFDIMLESSINAYTTITISYAFEYLSGSKHMLTLNISCFYFIMSARIYVS